MTEDDTFRKLKRVDFLVVREQWLLVQTSNLSITDWCNWAYDNGWTLNDFYNEFQKRYNSC